MIINMLKNKSQLKIGALITYFTIGFNIIAGLIYTPWMIDQIGQNDYGLYTLANSLIALFLMDFGLSSATARYVAKYKAENKHEELNKFLNIVYRLYIAIDAAIFVVLILVFFFIDTIYQNLTPDELAKFKVIYCIASLYSIISFPCVTFNGILNAYEEFLPLKTADLLQKVCSILFTVIALSFGMGLYALVAVNALSGLFAISIKFYYVRRNTKIKNIKINSQEKKSIFSDVFKFSLWSTIWALSQRLIFNITPTLLGIVVVNAAAAISVFGIITTIEGYFYIITTAINGMFLSRITRLMNKDKNGEELTSLATIVGRFQYALNGLLVVGFAFVGKDFISLWVGQEFIDAYIGILLIVIPGIFYNALQIIHTAIVVQNLVKYQAFIQITIGVINVICSLILSYFFGVIGASISISVAYFLRLILTFVLVKKKMKFNFKSFINNCYFKMSIPIIISLVLIFVVNPFISSSTWLMLAIKMLIIVVIYLLSVFAFGISNNEKRKLFSKIISKIKK